MNECWTEYTLLDVGDSGALWMISLWIISSVTLLRYSSCVSRDPC